MNVKNSASVMGANRSNSLVPVHKEMKVSEMPRHSSVSKPATNKVSPRIDNKTNAMHSKHTVKQTTCRDSIEQHKMHLNINNIGRNNSNEMIATSSSADREAYLVHNQSSLMNERSKGKKKGYYLEDRAQMSPSSTMQVPQPN